jgi:hypothetical protein
MRTSAPSGSRHRATSSSDARDPHVGTDGAGPEQQRRSALPPSGPSRSRQPNHQGLPARPSRSPSRSPYPATTSRPRRRDARQCLLGPAFRARGCRPARAVTCPPTPAQRRTERGSRRATEMACRRRNRRDLDVRWPAIDDYRIGARRCNARRSSSLSVPTADERPGSDRGAVPLVTRSSCHTLGRPGSAVLARRVLASVERSVCVFGCSRSM